MKRQKSERLLLALNSWEEGLARLAECVIQFQRIEEMLGSCISTMIGGTRTVGAIVTSEMSFRARVSVFGALLCHRLQVDTLPTDAVDVMKRVHWAEQERNRLVHSMWDASSAKPDTIRREKRTIRKSVLKVTREHITPDELDDLGRDFEGIAEDLMYVMDKHLPKLRLHLPR
jgi:hypothetical protein